ncbi:cell division ATP-binding protein FtsE [Mobilicoccus caccae]|uniref:Cell division ATP-binding protein FtsE n=1 Tax=Mobilicoccus caccae TaxID=1859295 RepID=A0ABQ6INL0_9MICO|nr:cell division ATP-binding protein FtsE [Mobilicoccus caccae]
MIRFDHVVKTYPRSTRPALDGIDLTVEAGEFVFLVGPSGSGKSTIVRLALCEEKVTSGGLTVAGRDLTTIRRRNVPALRREVGTVFQDFRLLPDKTVGQNVAYVLHVLGETPEAVRSAVPAALETVGLAGLEHRLPHQLSGGEQQRVAIARALVRRPTLLLADEPTGNLDPRTSLELVRLLEEINASGTTVVMATHDDRIVDTLRRRVVQLEAGRIVRDEAAGLYLRAPELTAEKTSGEPVRADSEVVPDASPPPTAAEADPLTSKEPVNTIDQGGPAATDGPQR